MTISPNMGFALFQMMFAIITPSLITGAVAGRMKFKAIFLFVFLWQFVVYYPMAHMVWGGGFLAQIGSIDFAGGNVVHISSGVSGLVLAILIGKRKGIEKRSVVPHNIPFVVLGASLLWFGWFGFNAGSALTADGLALHAFTTTNTSAACAMLFVDDYRYNQRRKADSSRSLYRRCYRFGGNYTGCRFQYRYGRRLLSVHLSARYVTLHYLY